MKLRKFIQQPAHSTLGQNPKANSQGDPFRRYTPSLFGHRGSHENITNVFYNIQKINRWSLAARGETKVRGVLCASCFGGSRCFLALARARVSRRRRLRTNPLRRVAGYGHVFSEQAACRICETGNKDETQPQNPRPGSGCRGQSLGCAPDTRHQTQFRFAFRFAGTSFGKLQGWSSASDRNSTPHRLLGSQPDKARRRAIRLAGRTNNAQTSTASFWFQQSR